MRLAHSASKADRAIVAMIGGELNEKQIELSKDEAQVLQSALAICTKAEALLESQYGEDWLIDTENDFMQASIALNNILEEAL